MESSEGVPTFRTMRNHERMLISEREATDHLARFTGVTRTPARLLLKTGVAGTPTPRSDGSLGYDFSCIDALTRRQFVVEEELAETFPTGLAIARLAPSRPWDAMATRSDQLSVLAGPWRMSLTVFAGISAYIRRDGPFPLVATTSGFVLAGAEISGLTWGEHATTLALRPAGGWFDRLARRVGCPAVVVAPCICGRRPVGSYVHTSL